MTVHWILQDNLIAESTRDAPAGWRVIELNSANSAGVYACDLGRIVDAVGACFG